MPRKAKVQAVPVEQADQREGLLVAGDVEVKTEAGQLTDVINEVNADADEVADAPEEVPVLTVPVAEPVEAKPKAKRTSKAKAKAEPPPEVTPSPVVEEAAPARVEDAKASCPDCGKPMSAKTLKYSHKCVKSKVAPEVTSRIVEIVEDDV